MNLFSIAVFMMVVLTIMITTPTTAASTFNFTDYCGVPPYPHPVPEFPRLKTKGAKLMDHYSLLRHGARTPLRTTCFANIPEAAQQVWGVDDCPYNTLGTHYGLTERLRETNRPQSEQPPLYPASIHPLPNKGELPGICHMGQLTQAGLMGAYNQGWRMGSYLNKTYPHGSFTTPQLVQQSTDSHRTRETAQAYLTGLLDWMPRGMVSGSGGLGYFDIVKLSTPLTFVDEETDLWKVSSNVCNTEQYTDEAYKHPTWQKFEKEIFNPLQQELQKKLNQTGIDNQDMYDCAKSHFCASEMSSVTNVLDNDGMKLDPLRGHKVVPEIFLRGTREMNRLETAMNDFWAWPLFGFDPIRGPKYMAGGHLYALSLLWKASAAKTSESVPKIFSVVGHDHGPMMTLVGALQLTPFAWPPYASMLNFEFWAVPNTTLIEQKQLKRQSAGENNSEDDDDMIKIAPATETTPYIRFIWANNVTIPKFCTKQALNDELCPASVVLQYLLTILPSHAECPGIRGLDTIGLISGDMIVQMKNDLDNVYQTQPQTTLAQTLTELDQYHSKFDNAIENTRKNSIDEEDSKPKEKSHREMWASMGL